MRSALCSDVGGVPEGILMVGAVPAVPAGERSAAGMGAMAPPPGVVVELPPAATVVVVADEPLPVLCDVFATFEDADEFDGEELQAARPSAQNAPSAASVQGRRRGSDMG
jgi:hypothetical protein